MITSSYDDNKLLKFITDYFMIHIAKTNLTDYFNIYFTNDICNDLTAISPNVKISIAMDGVTILPTSKEKLITVLINENVSIEFQIQYILHELCHVYDYILFADKYCNGNIFEIRNNKYMKILTTWSEFHVQLFIIPYYYEIIDFLCNTRSELSSDIRSFFYDAFNERFLTKDKHNDIATIDIMYYLGQIAMCNQFDPNHHYSVDERIILKYPYIQILNNSLTKCLTFDTFCANLENLHQLFY